MSKPNKRWAIAALCYCLSVATAHAELADRGKPVNLEADTMTVDDLKKVSIYQGNVILTQGTLTINADKLIVTENRDGSHHGSATGNPATFRQKREGVEEYVEGWGQRIEYDEGKDMVELFTQARMKRNQDEVRGNYISYDGKTEFFKVIGGKEAVTPNNPKGRVRAVIQPKKKVEGEVGGAASAVLKPSDSLANPREY
jgi:lipopolysaccharide export system protein LptA